MGLVFVEVMLAVEERFGIRLPDEELAERFDTGRMRTVGDLQEMIEQKLRQQEGAWKAPYVCPTSAAFYQVRRSLISAFGMPRNSIRPATRLESLLPRQGRREQWRRLGEVTALPLSSLDPSGAVQTLYGVPALGVALWLSIAHWGTIIQAPLMGPLPAVLAACLMAGGLLYLGHRLTAPLHLEIPRRHGTVGDLARCAVGMTAPRSDRTWCSETVTEALRCVFWEQLRVPPDEVTPDRTFDAMGVD